MKQLVIYILLFSLLDCGSNQGEAQNHQSNRRLVGGPCEGCEAIFEYGSEQLNNIDTLPDFGQGPLLKITGRVYKADSREAASDVILYFYHTNQQGIYPTTGDEKGWARRHGFIRGWVKTDKTGTYTLYTLLPASYPSRTEPAHIHLTVLEPNGKYYWMSSYYFSGDHLLTDKNSEKGPRGGNGVLELVKEGDMLKGKRDIFLGMNIPQYD